MKKKSIALITYLLVFALILPAVMSPAAAADNEAVLTSISHSAAGQGVISGFSITFTVPFSYSGVSVDFSNGLNYAPAAVTCTFPGGSSAVIGDASPINMEVSYTMNEEPGVSTYQISVVRAPKVNSTFTGDITKTASAPGTITFSAADFTANYTQNEGAALGHITINGTNPAEGELRLSGARYTFLTAVGVAVLGNLTFVSTAPVSGRVYQVTAYDTENVQIGTVNLTITVSAAAATDIPYTTNKYAAKPFTLSDFVSRCTAAVSATLDYIEFSAVPTNAQGGTLYYKYGTASSAAVTAGTKYYNTTDTKISDISFVPNSGFTGSVTISYTGVSTAATGAKSYTGKIVVTVTEPNDISYSTPRGTAVRFNVTSFSAICTDTVGGTLNYVRFTLPSSSYGTLYLNYVSASSKGTAVSASTSYYRASSPLIGDVYFEPNASYTGTSVTITYTGYNTSGASFTGKIAVTLTGTPDINYSVAKGAAIRFSVSDFNSACSAANGGATLNYVRFTLPSSSYGTLYLNYVSASSKGTAVSASNNYYRTATNPLIGDVYFESNGSYSGTSVTITYTGYTATGASYSGKIVITLTGTPDISYATPKGTAVRFSVSDFNTTCSAAVGGTLNYVRFTLPSSSYGTLYLNYVSSSSKGTAVSASTSYYRASSPLIGDVYFEPNSSYTGTSVTITYTGYNTSGTSFTGKIVVTLTGTPDINYSVAKGAAVRFSVSDFNTACGAAVGGTLNYVRFTLPSSSYGALYLNYISSFSKGTAVSASTSYYRASSPLIGDVYFESNGSYSGTSVTITYTGYNTSGTSFTGKIVVTLGTPNINYSMPKGTVVRFNVSDFNTVCGAAVGGTLNYVRFTLPSSSYGTLYLNYISSANKGTAVSASASYYRASSPLIGDVYFESNGSYTGTSVTITYTGYNTSGTSFTGAVKITIGAMSNFGGVNSYGPNRFTDVNENSWYGFNQQKVIARAFEYGLMKGTSDTKFNPTGNITVAEVVTIAARIYSIYSAGTENFIQGSPWYQVYVDYAIQNGIIAAGDFSDYTRPATRAETAYILSRSLPQSEFKEQNTVNTLPDVNSGTPYYNSIIPMYQAGVLTGNDTKGTFKPGNPIIRAEAAAIVSRVILPDMRAAGKSY